MIHGFFLILGAIFISQGLLLAQVPDRLVAPSLAVAAEWRSASGRFSGTGDRKPVDYTARILTLSGTLPAGDQLVLWCDVPVWEYQSADLTTGTPSVSNSGLADAEVGADYHLPLSDRIRMNLSVSLVLPSGTAGRLSNPVPLGQDELKKTGQIHLRVATGLPGLEWSAGAGGSLRDANRNHELFGEAGLYWSGESIRARVFGRILEPVGAVSGTADAINGRANGVRYRSAGTQLGWKLNEEMIIWAGAKTLLAGSSVAAWTSGWISVGWWFQ